MLTATGWHEVNNIPPTAPSNTVEYLRPNSSTEFDSYRRETDGEPKHHKAFTNFHFQFSRFPTDIIYNQPSPRPIVGWASPRCSTGWLGARPPIQWRWKATTQAILFPRSIQHGGWTAAMRWRQYFAIIGPTNHRTTGRKAESVTPIFWIPPSPQCSSTAVTIVHRTVQR